MVLNWRKRPDFKFCDRSHECVVGEQMDQAFAKEIHLFNLPLPGGAGNLKCLFDVS